MWCFGRVWVCLRQLLCAFMYVCAVRGSLFGWRCLHLMTRIQISLAPHNFMPPPLAELGETRRNRAGGFDPASFILRWSHGSKYVLMLCVRVESLSPRDVRPKQAALCC